MAKHALPVFPLLANVWHTGNPVTDPPDLANIKAELVVTVHHRQVTGTTTQNKGNITRFIYFEKGTDVRAIWPAGFPDVVELPAGSAKYYDIVDVDDVAKGFPNEFRVAAVVVTSQVAGPWPVPYP